MRGVWVNHGYKSYALKTHDGAVHALVRFDDGYQGMFSATPWLVYTMHTEGNDRLATEREAKIHARKRLRQLLEATEALR